MLRHHLLPILRLGILGKLYRPVADGFGLRFRKAGFLS